MTDRVCDNCKRAPDLMHTDDGQPCWFFIIRKGQDEPIALVFGKEEMPKEKQGKDGS